jgi:adenine deaminase
MARPPASARAIAAARGDEPADLLLRNGRILSTAARRWVDDDLAICDGVVVGWGRRDALEEIDVDGAALTPGFVDAHMHLESTKMWIDEFVRAVLPHGTTAVAADPHEVANVFGIPGVAALAEAATRMPFTFGICASSCVPASVFESSGAELDAVDVRHLIDDHGAIGVAEVMNYPGVIGADPEMLARIAAAGWRRVDGHAPGLGGRPLDAYLAAGVESDHECTRLAEAIEKRRKGMWVFIRQGSASQNLAELIPMVLEEGTDHVAFCTDDREPDTIAALGHVNDCVRLAVAAGVGEIDALVMATANPAEYHNLWHLGSLAPGYQADVLCFPTLSGWEPEVVWQRGQMAARGGSALPGAVPSAAAPTWMHASVHLEGAVEASDFSPASTGRVRVIGIEAGSLTTSHELVDLDAAAPGAVGLARLACVERHRGTGRIGLGWVTGFGLTRGAFASTVAHDAHNCMVVGAPDGAGAADMAVAVNRLAEVGGGQVVVLDGRVLAEMRLPIGGLMSDRPAAEIAAGLEAAVSATQLLGTTIPAPFMQLSFLGLSVIPQLRLTDRGLVDVDRFALTDVSVSGA